MFHMKKLLSVFVPAFLIMMAVSCSREIITEPVGNGIRIYSLSFDESTKTGISGTGGKRSVNWNEGDPVLYYTKPNQSVPSETAVSLTGDKAYAEISLGAADEFINAVYGATQVNSEGSTSDCMYVNSPVKNSQSYTSFSEAHICAAFSDDIQNSNLRFHNVAAILMFESTSEVHKVVFYGNDGETVSAGDSGDLKIVNVNDGVSAEPATTGGTSITVMTNGAVSEFYMAVLPVVFSAGITIECYDSDMELMAIMNTGKAINTVSSSGGVKILNLGKAQDWIENGSIVTRPVELSGSGTANCYIVSSPGDYCFKPVKGNSTKTEDVLAPKSARLLWQSYGTDEAVGTPTITEVGYSNGMILFTVPETMKEGNAVIAAYDDGGKVLWSWHIWVCSGYDPEASAQVYLERTVKKDKKGNEVTDADGNPVVILTGKTVATVMDRNLGALSATPGTLGALGLFYQWGRKDPFLGSSINYYAVSQPFAVGSPSSPGSTKMYSQVSVQYTIENPMTYVCVSNLDWQNSTNELLWDTTSKTIYDPCPPGWMIPGGGSDGLWAKSCGLTYQPRAPYDSKNYGVSYKNFTAETASPVWIPFAGNIQERTGTLNGTGGYLRVWSGTKFDSSKAYALHQGKNDTFNVVATYVKAEGCSVRCIKEK